MYIETGVDTFARTNRQICLTRVRKIRAKIPNLFFPPYFRNAGGEYPICNFRKKRKPTIFTACFNARPGVIHLFSRQTVYAVQEIKLFLPQLIFHQVCATKYFRRQIMVGILARFLSPLSPPLSLSLALPASTDTLIMPHNACWSAAKVRGVFYGACGVIITTPKYHLLPVYSPPLPLPLLLLQCITGKEQICLAARVSWHVTGKLN